MNDKIKKGQTKYLQRVLTFAGYACGKIDGIEGSKTLAAVDAWEDDENKAKELYGVFDARTENNLDTLLPSCQRAVRAWLAARVMPWARENGLEVKIICGTRTYAEQDVLYAQGRTSKGAKVTNARGGQSYHNFAIAFDLGLFKAGKYIEQDKEYKALYAACGAPVGFTWGGLWQSIVDTPHYQASGYGASVAAIRTKFER